MEEPKRPKWRPQKKRFARRRGLKAVSRVDFVLEFEFASNVTVGRVLKTRFNFVANLFEIEVPVKAGERDPRDLVRDKLRESGNFNPPPAGGAGGGDPFSLQTTGPAEGN